MAETGLPGDGVELGIAGYGDAVLIGRGGFGSVYRARQSGLDREVAVKILAVTGIDERTRRQFERERLAMGRLSGHPAIVTVHDSGFTTGGTPFLVMEYMEGGSLADHVAARGSFSWYRAVEIVVRITDALEAAHAAGVLHRDVKPENILMSSYGGPKLSDFGIATLIEGTATATESVTATIEHAAPEVLEGVRPSVASDVYSLGSTLFALLAGRPAFRQPTDESMLAVITRILTEPVPDLRSKGVPESVSAVVEWSMSKEPSERPPSAREFGVALDRAAADGGAETVVVSPADRPLPRGSSQEPASPDEDGSATAVLRWHLRLGAEQAAPARRGDRLLTGAGRCFVFVPGVSAETVHAVDLRSGDTHWQTRLAGRRVRLVEADDEVLVTHVSDRDEQRLIAIDVQTGEIRWQRLIGRAGQTHSVASDGWSAFASVDGHFTSWDLHSGLERSGPASDELVDATAVDGLVVAVTGRGRLVARDVESGSERWNREVGGDVKLAVRHAPLVVVSRLGSDSRWSLERRDPQTGRVVWQRASARPLRVRWRTGELATLLGERSVWVVDVQRGEEIWEVVWEPGEEEVASDPEDAEVVGPWVRHWWPPVSVEVHSMDDEEAAWALEGLAVPVFGLGAESLAVAQADDLTCYRHDTGDKRWEIEVGFEAALASSTPDGHVVLSDHEGNVALVETDLRGV